jgi:hypothetical protein
MRAILAMLLLLITPVVGDECALAGEPQGKDPSGVENQSEQGPSARPGESLSDQLDRNKGVITPPPTGDSASEITVPIRIPGRRASFLL